MKASQKKPSISVVIPFHNRIAWTVNAIKSAIDQTYKHLEILVIDNNSTEDISNVVALANTDNRIKILSQPTPGPSAARNLGISRATGDYICFLDSDDLWEPHKVETQLAFMKKNGAVFSHTDYRHFTHRKKNMQVVLSNINTQFPNLIARCTIAVPTVMLKKSILEKNNLRFPEQIHIGEDVCLWLQLSKNNPIHHLNQPLTKVRLHASNAAHDTGSQITGLVNIAQFSIKTFGLLAIQPEIYTALSKVKIKISKLNPTIFLKFSIFHAIAYRLSLNSHIKNIFAKLSQYSRLILKR